MEHDRVAPSAREARAVPRERRHARTVAGHRAHLPQLVDVPQLHLVVGGAHRHVRALGAPAERGHVGLLARRLHELLDRAVVGVPQVDGVAQRDAEHVVRRPIEQVEVVVVEELRRVEDALGRLRDVARVLPRRRRRLAVLGVQHAQRRLLALVERRRRLVAEREDLGRGGGHGGERRARRRERRERRRRRALFAGWPPKSSAASDFLYSSFAGEALTSAFSASVRPVPRITSKFDTS